jgi:hypothetical protein
MSATLDEAILELRNRKERMGKDPRYKEAKAAQDADPFAALKEEQQRFLTKYAELSLELATRELAASKAAAELKAAVAAAEAAMAAPAVGTKRSASIMGEVFDSSTWGLDNGKVNKALRAQANSLKDLAGPIADAVDAVETAETTGDFTKLKEALAEGERACKLQGEDLLLALNYDWDVVNTVRNRNGTLVLDEAMAKKLKAAQKEITQMRAHKQRDHKGGGRRGHAPGRPFQRPAHAPAAAQHAPSYAAHGQASRPAGQSHIKCFKCQQFGHMARECTVSK